MENKKLMRAMSNKMLMGVCSGLAVYTGMDVTVWRIIAVVASFITGGAAFIAYLIMGLIIPKDDAEV
ncbi:MAG: PspC domain-containing protein [Oscillospiraceae bacterium]|nr:PspC domain-containing protein [Oscillospiraceae bacterium]